MAQPIELLKNRLKQALSLKNMKPIELSEKTGIPKSAISQYTSGYAKPKQDRIYLICKALNVSEAWLMGYDVPMEKTPSNQKQAANSLSQKEVSLVTKYRAIDDDGKKVVDTIIDREYERATIPMLKAAHERTDVDTTDEMKQHDYDIMNDDNF